MGLTFIRVHHFFLLLFSRSSYFLIRLSQRVPKKIPSFIISIISKLEQCRKMNYSEDPVTIDLYPESAFEEDLTPDVIGEDIEQKCNDIHKACKGEIFLANATQCTTQLLTIPIHS
jgi:hypothetical protein